MQSTVRSSVLLLLLLAVIQIQFSSCEYLPSELTLLKDPLAKCMDGSQGGYYIQTNLTVKGGNTWVIHLEGGGECDTEAACLSRVNSTMGSSKFFNQTRWQWAFGVSDQLANPDFWDANHVLIPYCSSDLWTGRVEQITNGTFGLYFAGHFIVTSTIDALITRHGLIDSEDTNIILSGDSAGGIGTWINVDDLGGRFPASRVVVASFAGFYFNAYPYSGPNATQSYLSNFTSAGLEVAYNLWSSFVDETCAEAYEAIGQTPSACLLANNSFPYISSEAFVFEAQTDEVQLTAHDCIPAPPTMCNQPELSYIANWQANMSNALAPLMDPTNLRNGVFNPACFIHVYFEQKEPLINGIGSFEAFGNWFFQRSSPASYKLQDSCGELFCNPTCGASNPNPCPVPKKDDNFQMGYGQDSQQQQQQQQIVQRSNSNQPIAEE